MIYIGFTGHRDRLANPEDLYKIHHEYPDAVWVHGGARGFDSQVDDFANLYGHKTVIIKPDYVRYYYKIAPLERNKLIVEGCNVLVALWDGRKTGGTFYTIEYAKKVGKEIKYLRCEDENAKV